MQKDRLIALSDGIVAIAATIMVLELYVPKELSILTLMEQIPTFVAFFISFSLIYLSWSTHHKIFNKIDDVNGHMFVANGIWLLFTSLVPFITKLKGSFHDSQISSLIYVTVLVLWFLSIELLDKIAVSSSPNVQKDEISTNKYRGLFIIGIIIIYIVAYMYPAMTSLILLIFAITVFIHIYRIKKLD